MSRSNLPADWTPIQIAYYRNVHDFVDPRTGKKGAEALGPPLGKSPKAISNEANPEVPGHKPGLEDSATVQLFTRDFQTLHAYAATLHHTAIPLPDYHNCSDVELLTKFAEWQCRMGKTCEHIHRALEDGRVTSAEASRVRAAGYHHVQGFFEFLHRLETLVEEGE